ncbi:hypothetical protein AAE994_29105 [Klebsiella pneumoniae]|uniref:hypothetical protein n=1 Tax=Klebsiella pneumoniae TaxID=573 RepID=UPI003138560A
MIRCVCGKKIGPDPRNFNQRVSLGRNDLLIRTFLKYLGKKGDESNAKWDMGIMPSRDGNNYGFQFIKRDGKSWLNVQLLQNSMDAPKLIGSYPCKTV